MLLMITLENTIFYNYERNYYMFDYNDTLLSCDKKIENWDGYALHEFANTFSNQEIDAMMAWMSAECPFEIDCEYFLRIEKSSGYEVMRAEVITNYLQRSLMYMIDQTDTKNADRWYCKWNKLYK